MVEFVATPRTAARDDCGPNNLIKNCSFERTEIRANSWKSFNPDDVPDWTSVNGEKLELWGTGFLRVPASHGTNFLEMDAGRAAAGDGISQRVQTEKDAHYSISFDVRARGSNFDSDDEAIVIGTFFCGWNDTPF